MYKTLQSPLRTVESVESLPLHGPQLKVGIDFAHFKGKEYLIATDYFSRYPEITKTKSTTAQATIKAIATIFPLGVRQSKYARITDFSFKVSNLKGLLKSMDSRWQPAVHCILVVMAKKKQRSRRSKRS